MDCGRYEALMSLGCDCSPDCKTIGEMKNAIYCTI
uniref:Uncharacterized protein n=1 Tax=Anguilla anguilla TaxID=7936 RepID=A0A0E9RZ26_ANGAN